MKIISTAISLDTLFEKFDLDEIESDEAISVYKNNIIKIDGDEDYVEICLSDDPILIIALSREDIGKLTGALK